MVEQAYPQTPVGNVELKGIPPRVAYEAQGARDAFAERRALFDRNFRFLKANEMPMTTPVEVDVAAPAMRFFVPRAQEDATLRGVEGVRIRRTPDRLVVSAGLRGGYTRERFEEGRRRAQEWLATHPEFEATGPAEVAYWNGPFVPPFLRRMEVHLPVRERTTPPLT